MITINSLLFTCEHPKVITTKDNRRMVVSCGKCRSCLIQKMRSKAVDAMAGAILKKAQAVGVNISNKTANALSLDYIEKFGLDIEEQKERIKHTGKENDWYEWNHSIGSALNGLGLFISPSTFVGRSVVKGFK